eukprot:TRINITY_DN400_c0_g1_i2.p1 TRINITY_DN400_c0_g1~~TRINITY_DN400_c0_g1_i2.p1  ORF type:complete len:360 (-),score=76.04 TRINITY_DN400_c0_g1_i2:279-1358(-)
MGCTGSKSLEDAYSDQINRQLKEEGKKKEKEVKLLMLGTGESGKSTLVKQFRILYKGSFTREELLSYRPALHNNIVVSIQAMIRAAQRFLEEPGAGDEEKYKLSPANKASADKILQLDPLSHELQYSLIPSIKAIWLDPAIQATFLRSSEYQLADSAKYVLDDIERIANPETIPTQTDLLRVRSRTTGIVETEFLLDEYRFRVMDVGGQRSERKKWIHCFEGVTAIIFAVALNEYDLKLFEDNQVNRLVEAEELFKEICNSEWFRRTDIIIFFNKNDLFVEKIKRVPLGNYFKDYTGGDDYDKALEYIKNRFKELNDNKEGRHSYMHVTTGIDTENVRAVFHATKDIIFAKSLENAGFA